MPETLKSVCSIAVMARLKTPIVTSVIGEGGSGGALAIGVCDKLLMLEFSTYSVISPEGCASILWKSAAHAPEAAEAMAITADRLFSLGLVDQLVREPLGGAHRAQRANIPAGRIQRLHKGHVVHPRVVAQSDHRAVLVCSVLSHYIIG